MHLVPPQAIVQDYPIQRTFADMRQAMVLTSHNANNKRTFSDLYPRNGHVGTKENFVAIGCGDTDSYDTDHYTKNKDLQKNGHDDNGPSSDLDQSRRRRRLQMVDDASFCNNQTNFYCWMSCLSIPDAANSKARLDKGESLYCADPSVLAQQQSSTALEAATSKCNEVVGRETVIGLAMDEACVGVWQPTYPGLTATPVVPSSSSNETNNNSSNSDVEEAEVLPWCWGGTSMYMDGFHWINPTCVTFLFPPWVLTTRMKFVGACIGTVLFGLMIELVIRQRRRTVTGMPIGWYRLFVSTFFYGLQLSMGYMIMLVVMTFSGPLFLSVVLGFMIGHIACNVPEVLEAKKTDLPISKEEQKDAVAVSVSGDSTSDNDQHEKQENALGQIPTTETSLLADCCSKQPKPQNNGTYTKLNMVPEGVTPCCQNTL